MLDEICMENGELASRRPGGLGKALVQAFLAGNFGLTAMVLCGLLVALFYGRGAGFPFKTLALLSQQARAGLLPRLPSGLRLQFLLWLQFLSKII